MNLTTFPCEPPDIAGRIDWSIRCLKEPPFDCPLLGALRRSAHQSRTLLARPGDPINRAWFHTLFVTQTGTLAQFVKAAVGLSDAQLLTILAAAILVTE